LGVYLVHIPTKKGKNNVLFSEFHVRMSLTVLLFLRHRSK
jgi:hypothetical protein